MWKRDKYHTTDMLMQNNLNMVIAFYNLHKQKYLIFKLNIDRYWNKFMINLDFIIKLRYIVV